MSRNFWFRPMALECIFTFRRHCAELPDINNVTTNGNGGGVQFGAGVMSRCLIVSNYSFSGGSRSLHVRKRIPARGLHDREHRVAQPAPAAAGVMFYSGTIRDCLITSNAGNYGAGCGCRRTPPALRRWWRTARW